MPIAYLQVETDTKKTESANTLPFAVSFHGSAYFGMGAYKRNVVVVIKMGAYVHGVFILCGCLLSRFYGNTPCL